jgi:hypothetical protein
MIIRNLPKVIINSYDGECKRCRRRTLIALKLNYMFVGVFLCKRCARKIGSDLLKVSKPKPHKHRMSL